MLEKITTAMPNKQHAVDNAMPLKKTTTKPRKRDLWIAG